MTKTALELYLYMNNSEQIINWLNSEGVTTKEQARSKLIPLVQSNIRDVLRASGGSLAGTAHCAINVIDHFKD